MTTSNEEEIGYRKFLADLEEKLNIKPWNDWRTSSERDRIGVSWCLGGTSGSCWNDHLSTVSGDNEPDFSLLDDILEQYCASISYLKYKCAINKLLHTDERGEKDWYGGYVNYKSKYVYLKDLYSWLKENEFVE